MDMTAWLLVAAAALIGFLAGRLAAGQALAKAKAQLATVVSRAQFDALAQEKTALATKLDAARTEHDKLLSELRQERSEKTALHERALKAEAQSKTLEAQLKDQQEQLRHEFKNVATTICNDISAKFSTQSEEKIGNLLNPMRERFNEFQKLVNESFGTQSKEQHTLKAEIERIVKMNEAMRLETGNLTKALRGDVKAQGNWGEVMLERILEESGLRKDEDYILQAADMGLTGAEGNRLKPDVIVNLPEGKHIIIDSKVSLSSYDRYCAEADDTLKLAHLKDFLRSVKNHVNGLGEKSYPAIEKLTTPDFVLMFMPIEGAYSLAIQQDRELHSYAWGKKIVLVCPATLFATLRTIASLWRIEKQNRHADEIARQAGAMYDKLVGFITDMEAIDKHLDKAQDSYQQAMNKLSMGKGNLINSAEKIRLLGAKNKKALTLQGEDGPLLDDALLEAS